MMINAYKIVFGKPDENYLKYLGVDYKIKLKCVIIYGMREFTRRY